jgi:hypothetical protein
MTLLVFIRLSIGSRLLHNHRPQSIDFLCVLNVSAAAIVEGKSLADVLAPVRTFTEASKVGPT